jgi:hypothetical protein
MKSSIPVLLLAFLLSSSLAAQAESTKKRETSQEKVKEKEKEEAPKADKVKKKKPVVVEGSVWDPNFKKYLPGVAKTEDIKFYFLFSITGTVEQINRYNALNGVNVYDTLAFGGAVKTKYFDSVGTLTFRRDEKVYPSEPYFLGHYMELTEGYIKFHYEGKGFGAFILQGGRMTPKDYFDSPYSLYISSAAKSSVGLYLSYSNPFFFYESRWIQLTFNSIYSPEEMDPTAASFITNAIKYPDKSANIKTTGFKVGDFRFGLQDSIVYLGRTFDPEYFLSPLPQFAGQLVTTFVGRPWTSDQNDMANLGFFLEWGKKGKYEAKGSFLLDDVNLDFLPGVNSGLVSKAAWAIGGYYTFKWGKLSFWHAGALKYSFAATYTDEDWNNANLGSVYYSGVPSLPLTTSPWSLYPYEYTYYPMPEYSVNGVGQPVYVEDMYLGYKYGENAISFIIEYENYFFKGKPYDFHLYASLEYVANGTKMPNNPWHLYDDPVSDLSQPAYLLDEAVLEHRIIATAIFTKEMRVDYFHQFKFIAKVQVGGIFNRLKLVSVSETYDYGTSALTPKAYVPQEGEHLFIFTVTLGATYMFNVLQ